MKAGAATVVRTDIIKLMTTNVVLKIAALYLPLFYFSALYLGQVQKGPVQKQTLERTATKNTEKVKLSMTLNSLQYLNISGHLCI